MSIYTICYIITTTIRALEKYAVLIITAHIELLASPRIILELHCRFAISADQRMGVKFSPAIAEFQGN